MTILNNMGQRGLGDERNDKVRVDRMGEKTEKKLSMAKKKNDIAKTAKIIISFEQIKLQTSAAL